MAESHAEETTRPQSETASARLLDRQPMALEITKRHAMYAAAVGLIPIPLANAAGVVAVEIKLLRDLARHYDVPFQRDRVKSLAGALLGGALSTEVGLGAAGLVKGAPLLGGALCFAAMPVVGGAVTYAIGKVFIQHFESGGTFLDFDPAKVKQYFEAQFQQAKTATS
jgi:uncharacterized protein (DUF697 family)